MLLNVSPASKKMLVCNNMSQMCTKHGEVFARSVACSHNKYFLSPNPSAMDRYTALKSQIKLAHSSEASYERPQSRPLPRTCSSREQHDEGSTLSCSLCSVLCSCLRYKAYVGLVLQGFMLMLMLHALFSCSCSVLMLMLCSHASCCVLFTFMCLLRPVNARKAELRHIL